MLLISLIGEQPIPNLLPIRYLKPDENLLVYTPRTESVAKRLRRLISSSESLSLDVLADPYDIQATLTQLRKKLSHRQTDLAINLTGGTKLMVLAGYSLAKETGSPFVYLQSEGHKSMLYRYGFRHDEVTLESVQEIPCLITLDDYLKAHLSSYTPENFSHDEKGNLTPGGEFEKEIYQALQPRLEEVIANVRPQGGGWQVEIDLLVRCGNQVGIVEIKSGGSNDSAKRALDQLKMAGEPRYLGTYAAQFMIVGSGRLNAKVAELAKERGVAIFYVPEYQPGKALDAKTSDRLANEIKRKLST